MLRLDEATALDIPARLRISSWVTAHPPVFKIGYRFFASGGNTLQNVFFFVFRFPMVGES